MAAPSTGLQVQHPLLTLPMNRSGVPAQNGVWGSVCQLPRRFGDGGFFAAIRLSAAGELNYFWRGDSQAVAERGVSSNVSLRR